jgi:hypothetical protein
MVLLISELICLTHGMKIARVAGILAYVNIAPRAKMKNARQVTRL